MKDTVKKYQFGAGFGDMVNEELAVQQMRARNFLRNELVALDHATREQYYAIVNLDNPAQVRIEAISAEIATLRQAIKMKRVPVAGQKSGKGMVKVGACAEKDALDLLKKELTDLKPVAAARRLETKASSGEALFKMNHDRNEAIKTLRTRAITGYTYQHQHGGLITVNALYNLNADEIIDQHQTERSRAMKDKTELRFHKFIGEGRSSVRVHSHRDLSDGKAERFEELQAAINVLKEQRREAKSKEAKQALSEQISAHEMQRDMSVPNIVGQSIEKTMAGDSTLFFIKAGQEAENPETRSQIASLDRDAKNPTVWDKRVPRAQRRRSMRMVASVRIQSDEKGKPVWMSIPVVMHRPFPVGARILSAAINREKIGMKFRWNVEFTVKYQEQSQSSDLNARNVTVKYPSNTNVVAIDLGWAKDSLPEPDGRIRVAGLGFKRELQSDTDGALLKYLRPIEANGSNFYYEFCLPASFAEYAAKLDDIQAIRDKHTNECFARIAEFRETNVIEDEALRTLLDKAEQSNKQSQSKGLNLGNVWHLRASTWMLRKQSRSADLESRNFVVTSLLQGILEHWYERWNHLNEWLANGRDNQLAAKKDMYRRFAYQLAQRNDTLLLDADNFAKMAKEKAAEHDEKPAKGDVRFLAAPAMLRSALEAAFHESKGKRVLWASIASSKTCSKCWELNETLGAARTFVCPACGHTADREANAVANIMGEFERKPGTFSGDKKTAERLASKKAEEAAEIAKSAAAQASGKASQSALYSDTNRS